MIQRGFEDSGIKGQKIRLSNDTYFLARSFDNKSDIPVFKVNQNNEIEFFNLPKVKDQGSLLLDIESANYFGEKKVLSVNNVLTKSLELTHTPSFPYLVHLVPKGGPLQEIDEDFYVDGKFLRWNGKGLDGMLEAGEVVMLFYKT